MHSFKSVLRTTRHRDDFRNTFIFYSRRKNNPAQSMITKRDFILRGSCFCEKFSSHYLSKPRCYVDTHYTCLLYSQ